MTTIHTGRLVRGGGGGENGKSSVMIRLPATLGEAGPVASEQFDPECHDTRGEHCGSDVGERDDAARLACRHQNRRRRNEAANDRFHRVSKVRAIHVPAAFPFA